MLLLLLRSHGNSVPPEPTVWATISTGRADRGSVGTTDVGSRKVA